MRKKVMVVLVTALLAIVLLCMFFLRSEKTAKVKNSDITLSFSILGDIHNQGDRFQIALRDLYEINQDLDAIVLNGDVVDEGLEQQYKNIDSRLKKNKRYLPETIIKNIGNHEFYDYSEGSNSQDEVKLFIERYLKFSGEEKVYHDIWVKDYHFISLGSEQSHTPELGSTQAFLSDNQLAWLKAKLEERHEKGKPIFLFLHQHLNLNIAGTQVRWQGVKQNNELIEILSKYPEIIMFTSHTHASLEQPNSIIQHAFTSVHVGPVKGPTKIDEKGNRVTSESIQGIYVEVYKDKVLIRGRDFQTGNWFDSASYTVNLNK